MINMLCFFSPFVGSRGTKVPSTQKLPCTVTKSHILHNYANSIRCDKDHESIWKPEKSAPLVNIVLSNMQFYFLR